METEAESSRKVYVPAMKLMPLCIAEIDSHQEFHTGSLVLLFYYHSQKIQKQLKNRSQSISPLLDRSSALLAFPPSSSSSHTYV